MRRLAVPSMGESYLAVDAEAGVLDLHLLPANDTTKDVVLALAKLAHPNLARLRDAGLADGDLYLVEDHIEGVSLADLSNHGPLPGDVILHITAALASCLAEVEQVVAGQPMLSLRVPKMEEILVSAVGQVKTRLTTAVALPSSAETVIELAESVASSVAQVGRPVQGRPKAPQGPAAAVGSMVSKLLGPPRADDDQATKMARELAETAQKGQGREGDCRALHDLAVSQLRQVLASKNGGFVFRKLSDLVEEIAPRIGSEEADVAASGALLLAALPEGTPRAQKVRSWYDPSDQGERSGKMPAGTHVLGQQLAGTPYKLLRKLGVGGMGIVFEAEHVDLVRHVALKLLHGNLNRDPQVLARFRQEARSAARIRHAHIVEIYDFGTTSSGEVFLVMELLEGQSLTRVLRGGALPLERAISILWQTAEGVEAAHQAGVIHRDLKPDNVMVMPQRRAQGWPDVIKVLDFGIAKMREGFFGPREPGQTITRQGQLFGTPEYMAPEQILSGKTDHRVDIYSLGCIAYEMITGGLPFPGESYGEMLAAHIKDMPVPPHVRAPDRMIPQALSDVVLRAMAKEPERRYSSMAEFGSALLSAMPGVHQALLISPPIGITPPFGLPQVVSGIGSTGATPTNLQGRPSASYSMGSTLTEGTAGTAALTPQGVRLGWQRRLVWGGVGAVLGLCGLVVWISQQEKMWARFDGPVDRSVGMSATAAPRGEVHPSLAAPAQPLPTDGGIGPEAATVVGKPKPEAKTEAKPVAQIEAKPPARPQVLIEAKPEPKPEIKPEAKPEIKPEAKPETKPETKPEPKPESKIETQPETKVEPKPESHAEPKPKAEPESKDPKEPKAERKAETKVEIKPSVPPSEPPPALPPVAILPRPVEQRYSGGRLTYQIRSTTSAYGKRDAGQGLVGSRSALESCYIEAIRQYPTRPPRGTSSLSFAINEDGMVMAGRSSIQGPAESFKPCLERALSRARFPRPEIGPTQISLELLLEPLP